MLKGHANNYSDDLKTHFDYRCVHSNHVRLC